jgi:hypothetical protein
MVVVRETQGATRTTCRSGSSLVGCTPIRIAATLLDMSNRLLVVVISLVYLVVLMAWIRGVQTFWEFFYKFLKIPTSHNLHEYEFRLTHLYSKN